MHNEKDSTLEAAAGELTDAAIEGATVPLKKAVARSASTVVEGLVAGITGGKSLKKATDEAQPILRRGSVRVGQAIAAGQRRLATLMSAFRDTQADLGQPTPFWRAAVRTAVVSTVAAGGLHLALQTEIGKRWLQDVLTEASESQLAHLSGLPDHCEDLYPNTLGKIAMAATANYVSMLAYPRCQTYDEMDHSRRILEITQDQMHFNDLQHNARLALPSQIENLRGDVAHKLYTMLVMAHAGHDQALDRHIVEMRESPNFEGEMPAAEAAIKLFETAKLIDLNGKSQDDLYQLSRALAAELDMEPIHRDHRDAQFVVWAIRNAAARATNAPLHSFQVVGLIEHGVTAKNPEAVLSMDIEQSRVFLQNAYRGNTVVYKEIARAIEAHSFEAARAAKPAPRGAVIGMTL